MRTETSGTGSRRSRGRGRPSPRGGERGGGGRGVFSEACPRGGGVPGAVDPPRGGVVSGGRWSALRAPRRGPIAQVSFPLLNDRAGARPDPKLHIPADGSPALLLFQEDSILGARRTGRTVHLLATFSPSPNPPATRSAPPAA